MAITRAITSQMPPRETKHKGDGLEQEQPSAESEFGEILSPEAQEQGQQGAVNDYDDGDDGTGAGRGKDDEATSAIIAGDEDRPVEVSNSVRDDSAGKGGAEEEDEASGDVPDEEDGGNDDDDDGVSEGDNVTDADADADGDSDAEVNDDDMDDDVGEDDNDTAEVSQDAESANNASKDGKESGDEKDSKAKTAKDSTKTTKPYPDVLRGPHAQSNEELNKLRGSHDRDKALDTMPMPADDEKAKNASVKERTKGSPEVGTEQGEERSPHKNLGPSAPTAPKGRQHHSPSPAECNVFSLPCHAKAAYSTHPLTFVLVAATFVLLLIRRIRHRNRNNINTLQDGRGEYATIELLEGNFDDDMSFTAEDEDPDDIIASWRGDTGTAFVASGVGDDLEDVADGELSLSELNG